MRANNKLYRIIDEICDLELVVITKEAVLAATLTSIMLLKAAGSRMFDVNRLIVYSTKQIEPLNQI